MGAITQSRGLADEIGRALEEAHRSSGTATLQPMLNDSSGGSAGRASVEIVALSAVARMDRASLEVSSPTTTANSSSSSSLSMHC